jgi:predicted TIM-barrel fold metal-dependent hydrolase
VSDELVKIARAGKRLDIPVIDVHTHAGQWALFDDYTENDHIAEMDRIGVKFTAISSMSGISGDVRRGNDEIAALLARHPKRFVGYVHVNANYANEMLPELERCFALPGFAGIKVYQQGVPYDDPRFDPAWEMARERNVPVLAHTWAGNLTGFDKVAKRYPSVAFFAAHAGSEHGFQPYIDAARAARNFYLDLTYSRDITNLVEHFVKTVGADQIVWGSDQPLFSMAEQAGKVLFSRISDDDKCKILHGNAEKLFSVKE